MTDSSPPIRLFVPGHPQPRGSKSPWVPRRRDGSLATRPDGRAAIVCRDSNTRSGPWMDLVRWSALEALGCAFHPLAGPVELCAVFYLPRPKSHYRRAGLRADAPQFHTSKPDLAKLIRAVEDALTGLVWGDDRQVVRYGLVAKRWIDPGREGCELTVTPIVATGTRS